MSEPECFFRCSSISSPDEAWDRIGANLFGQPVWAHQSCVKVWAQRSSAEELLFPHFDPDDNAA
jgi:hypothetical protein